MIVTDAYENVKQRGNLDVSLSRPLGIDEANLAPILNTLTHMYTDPWLAVVREYASNARDSHVEAGNTAPIEVSLPTTINPQLVIQDYGMGLSEEEIEKVYAWYGTSTKRNSNAFIGAMGIGSKSGFAVGNQFTVTGVKDGIKTVALFAKNVHGEPTINTLLSGLETDEPNGVRVEIGIEHVGAIRDAAKKLFYTWDQGTVHVDGERPEHIWTDPDLVNLSEPGDYTYYLLPTSNADTHRYHLPFEERFRFLMGGVSYQLESAVLKDITMINRDFIDSFSNANVTFYVDMPIGSLDLAPSREHLRASDHTITSINQAIRSLREHFDQWLAAEIDQAPTFTDAARKARVFANKFNWPNYDRMTWRGQKFENLTINLDYQHFTLKNRGRYSWTEVSPVTKLHEKTRITISDDFDEWIFVSNVPVGKEQTVRRYVKAVLLARGENPRKCKLRIVVTPHASEQINWFAYGHDGGVETITYEDFRTEGKKAMQLQRPAGSPVSSGPSVLYTNVMTNGKITLPELKKLDKVAFYHHEQNTSRYSAVVSTALDGYTVIQLSRGQTAKALKRRLPKIVEAPVLVVAEADKILASVTEADRNLLRGQRSISTINNDEMHWFARNKSRLTNQPVLDWFNQYEDAKKATAEELSRVRILGQAQAIKATTIDLGSINTDHSFVHEKLPVLKLYLSEQYEARRIQPDTIKWDTILIDYVNRTTI